MTSAQRIQHRPSSVAILGGSLAIGASFLTGIVVGGPVLDLGPASTTLSRDSLLTDAGRNWQSQHEQQTPRHWPDVAVGASALDASGERWLQEHEQQTPVHRPLQPGRR